MAKFNTTSILGQHADADQTVRAPARRPTPQSDWLTPGLQALTISLGVALLVTGAALWFEVRPKDAFGAGAATLLIVFVITFIWLMNRAHGSLYHRVDYIKPKEVKENRPLVVSARGKHNSDEAKSTLVTERAPDRPDPECPFAPKTMRWFVWHCEYWGSTGHETWDPMVGRGRYLRWRESLLKAGWAEWTSYGGDGKPNKTKGWYLVTNAKDVCRSIREKNVEPEL